jgi:hypothetical protein
MFRSYKEEIEKDIENKNKYEELLDRVHMLPDEKQKIIKSYLNRAPKNFGHNMQKIMEQKEMTLQDILNIIQKFDVGKGIGISHIQSFKTCIRPQKNKELIPYISRILLVDESVLYTGIGNSFGTWKPYLSTSAIKLMKGKQKIKSVREGMRGFIKDVVESPETLATFLKDIAKEDGLGELHQVKEINIYAIEDTKTIDVKEQIENLLEPESIYVLLDVLESTPVL